MDIVFTITPVAVKSSVELYFVEQRTAWFITVVYEKLTVVTCSCAAVHYHLPVTIHPSSTLFLSLVRLQHCSHHRMLHHQPLLS